MTSLSFQAELKHSNDTSTFIQSCGIGKYDDCAQYLISESKLDPNKNEFYFDLGNALRSSGNWQETAKAYQLALDVADRSGSLNTLRQVLVLLGRTYIELGLWEEAILQFDRAVNMQRNVILPEALYRLLFLQHFACNFTSRSSLLHDAKDTVLWELSSGTSKMTPSQALMMLEGPLLYGLSQMFSRSHYLAASEQKGEENGPWLWNLADFLSLSGFSVSTYGAYSPQHLTSMDGRLKIGYVSKDFGFSSVGQLLPRLFSGHDRRRFKITVYSIGGDDGSHYYKEVKEVAQRFENLAGRPASEIAARINADSINIVLDLSGHFSVTSQVALAMQPAPVAISYLGWLSTSGASYVQVCTRCCAHVRSNVTMADCGCSGY
jgi:hypothetical protein